MENAVLEVWHTEESEREEVGSQKEGKTHREGWEIEGVVSGRRCDTEDGKVERERKFPWDREADAHIRAESYPNIYCK